MRDDPTAVFAIVEPRLRPKEDGVGLGRNQAKYLLEDVPEAHLAPGPDRVQQNGSSNLTLVSAAHVTQGEPSLVATFVAEQVDVAWVTGRGPPISPLQEFSRSVNGNPVCGPVAAKKIR